MRLYTKLFTSIIIAYTFSAYADKYCMQGIEPTKNEFLHAQQECENFAKTINDLGMLAAKDTNNTDIKRKFEAAHRLMIKKANQYSEIFSKIEVPVNLKECKEINFSPKMLRELNEKWQYMATFYSTNEQYIYNVKLLNAISFEIAFN